MLVESTPREVGGVGKLNIPHSFSHNFRQNNSIKAYLIHGKIFIVKYYHFLFHYLVRSIKLQKNIGYLKKKCNKGSEK